MTSIAEIKKIQIGQEANWDNEIGRLTPRSKENALKYREQVLNAKSLFVQEFCDEDQIILEYKASYVVPKFMIVTMKLLGNILVCDDNKSVSILNPKNMQKMHSIPNPTENSYLYAVSKHEASKTILMSYDNKMIIGYDSLTYNRKSSMTIDFPCLWFTELHSDP